MYPLDSMASKSVHRSDSHHQKSDISQHNISLAYKPLSAFVLLSCSAGLHVISFQKFLSVADLKSSEK